MAKAKGPAEGVQNRHIYTRASYLYQAATYLANRAHDDDDKNKGGSDEDKRSQKDDCLDKEKKALMNMSRQMVSDMRSVSLKSLIRRSPAIKRTICKFCNTLQVEGKTCRSTIENASKGGRKPWADVLVIRCNTCSHAKRFPVSAARQKKWSMRARVPDVDQEDVKGSKPA